jgi:hypothetical protein
MKSHPLGCLFIFRSLGETLYDRIIGDPVNERPTETIEFASHESILDEIAPIHQRISLR